MSATHRLSFSNNQCREFVLRPNPDPHCTDYGLYAMHGYWLLWLVLLGIGIDARLQEILHEITYSSYALLNLNFQTPYLKIWRIMFVTFLESILLPPTQTALRCGQKGLRHRVQHRHRSSWRTHCRRRRSAPRSSSPPWWRFPSQPNRSFWHSLQPNQTSTHQGFLLFFVCLYGFFFHIG